MSQPSRVFISHGRKDVVALAQRLKSDLMKEGFDAWLDTQRIAGGATWTEKIEHAFDEDDYVLALMTSGSYISEICRAEQLRFAQRKVCHSAYGGTLCRLHLEAENYHDFTARAAATPQPLLNWSPTFTRATEFHSRRNSSRGMSLRRRCQSTSLSGPRHWRPCSMPSSPTMEAAHSVYPAISQPDSRVVICFRQHTLEDSMGLKAVVPSRKRDTCGK